MAKPDYTKYPYFDDLLAPDPSDPTKRLVETKRFTKMEFVPGRAPQARELTQIQTLLQYQMEQNARMIARDGDIISGGSVYIYDDDVWQMTGGDTGGLSGDSCNPGNITISDGVTLVTIDLSAITSYTTPEDTAEYLQDQIRVSISGVKVFYSNGSYIIGEIPSSYGLALIIANGTSNAASVLKINYPTQGAIESTYSALCAGAKIYGRGMVYEVSERDSSDPITGISKTGEEIIGLWIKETTVVEPGSSVDILVGGSSESDSSLYDPAEGYANEGQPGAHRWKQEAVWELYDPYLIPSNEFIGVILIRDGAVINTAQPPILSTINDVLARRTYDESGHYIAKGMKNRIYNSLKDATNYFMDRIDAGKNYVLGYEVVKSKDIELDIRKGTDKKQYNNIDELYTSIDHPVVLSHQPAVDISDVSCYLIRSITMVRGGGAQDVIPLAYDPGTPNFLISVFYGGTLTWNWNFDITRAREGKLYPIGPSPYPGEPVGGNTEYYPTQCTSVGNNIIDWSIATTPPPGGSTYRIVYKQKVNLEKTITASITGSNPGDFDIQKGFNDQIVINIDSVLYGPITISSGSNRTPQAICDDINKFVSDTTGHNDPSDGSPLDNPATVTEDYKIKITSLLHGNYSSVLIVGGSACVTLGFTTGVPVTGVTKDYQEIQAPAFMVSSGGTGPGNYNYGGASGKVLVFSIDEKPDITVTLPSNDIRVIANYINQSVFGTADEGFVDIVGREEGSFLGVICRLRLMSRRGGKGSSIRIQPGTTFDGFAIGIVTPESEDFVIDLRDLILNRQDNPSSEVYSWYPSTSATASFCVHSGETGYGTQVTMDYFAYLWRYDLITCDRAGNIFITEGISGEDEDDIRVPDAGINVLPLAYIRIPPGTHMTADAVSVININNRRLTMKELRQIENRVDELEWRTAKESMDQQGKDTSLPEDLRGVFTDVFNDLSKADFLGGSVQCFEEWRYAEGQVGYDRIDMLSYADFAWKASLDIYRRFLSLPYTEYFCDLVLDPAGIQQYETVITALVVSTETILIQPYATGSFEVNPYQAFDRRPTIKINPSIDMWLDMADKRIVQKKPDIDPGWIQEWHKNPVIDELLEKQQDEEGWRSGSSDDYKDYYESFWTSDLLSLAASRKIIEETIMYVRSGKEIKIYGDNFIDDATGLGADNIQILFDGVPVAAENIGFDGSYGGSAGSITTPVATIKANSYIGPPPPSKIGRFCATFRVPEKRIFGAKLIEAKSLTAACHAETNYYAKGVDRDIVEDVRRRWPLDSDVIDPVAQTFYVEEDRILTKIGVYLMGKDTDDDYPLIIEVRDTLNGYPGPTALGRKVYIPSDLFLLLPDCLYGNFETIVEFEDPIFLEAFKEYCIVLKSNSNKYKTAVGEVGKYTLDGQDFVAAQPLAVGVFFSSSNDSAWTAHQNMDLKFKLYAGKYAIGEHIANFDELLPVDFDNAGCDRFSTMILAIDSLINKYTDINWEYSIDSGSNWSQIIPYNQLDIEKYLSGLTRKIDIRARMIINNERVSPIISTKVMQLFVRRWEYIYPDSGLYTNSLVEGIDWFNLARIDFKSLLISEGDIGSDPNSRQAWPLILVRDRAAEERHESSGVKPVRYRLIKGIKLPEYPLDIDGMYFHYAFEAPLRCLEPNPLQIKAEVQAGGGDLDDADYYYRISVIAGGGESVGTIIGPITTGVAGCSIRLIFFNGEAGAYPAPYGDYTLDSNVVQVRIARSNAPAGPWVSEDYWLINAKGNPTEPITDPEHGMFIAFPLDGAPYVFEDTLALPSVTASYGSINEAMWTSDTFRIKIVLCGSSAGSSAALVPRVRELSVVLNESTPSV